MEVPNQQLGSIADRGSFEPERDDLASRDPLAYPGYRASLESARRLPGSDEAVVAGRAQVGGHDVELALFNFAFMGGSMGEVAGERLARAMERAAQRQVPFVLRTATGGARMQEGMRSLIQMPKVVVSRMALARAGRPFIASLGHPTTGGVLASLAALSDLTVAEQDATIGFAGPRVAQGATGRSLPAGSHTASFAYDNGMVDAVVPAEEAADWIAGALDCLAVDDPEPAPSPPAEADPDRRPDPWAALQEARAQKPSSPAMLDRWCALNGDRAGGRGEGVTSVIGRIWGRRLLLLDTGGAPIQPSGLRKATRCVDLATRLGLPIVTLVDTPGADPSAGSEAQGVAWLIAQLIEKMLSAAVPILSIVTGEGGSGGALAFATADTLVAYETSVFSVIRPEGAAEILWKDTARAPDAARALKITAHDLHDLGIADQVVAGGPALDSLRRVVTYHLDRLEDDADPSPRRRHRWRNTW